MLNIEIYGFGYKEKEAAEIMRSRIRLLLSCRSYAKDCVVTVINSSVMGIDGRLQRLFLRLNVTTQDPVDDILEALQKLEVDIEVALISCFISKGG